MMKVDIVKNDFIIIVVHTHRQTRQQSLIVIRKLFMLIERYNVCVC